jgi:hypothetical protein
MSIETKVMIVAQIACLVIGVVVGGVWGGIAATVAGFWICWLLRDA